MARPACVVAPFEGSTDEAAAVAGLEALCEAAVLFNIAYLREHPETPALYLSDVRYRLEPDGGSENVYTIPFVLRRKRGDCDALAAWRAAELRVAGEPSRVRIERASADMRSRDYHAVVTRRNGFEDPSAMLYVTNG